MLHVYVVVEAIATLEDPTLCSQVTRFKRLTRRADDSKHRVLATMKKELKDYLPEKRPNYNAQNKGKGDSDTAPLMQALEMWQVLCCYRVS